MNILVSNDDGITSPGLRLLVDTLSELGDVYVAAPLHNKSGASHSLTCSVPLRADRADYPGAVGAWAGDGTPADCVKLGISSLLEVPVDLVVSGINNGANLGTDVIYSGTVAAAMEGLFHQIPAVAVSVCNSKRNDDTSGNYRIAADTALKYARLLLEGRIPRTLININVPFIAPEQIKGERFTEMGWRWYDSAYTRRTDPTGRDYFWLQGRPVDRMEEGKTDVEAIADGFISINPLYYDLTDHSALSVIGK